MRSRRFLLEMEKSRVVARVGRLEKVSQTPVNASPLLGVFQPFVWFEAPVLAYPKEDHTINDLLNGVVQLALRQSWILRSDVNRERLAPRLHLTEEGFVDLGLSTPGLVYRVAVE